MTVLYAFIGGAVCSFGFVMLVTRFLQGDIAKAAAKDREVYRERISKLDQEIEDLLEQSGEMSSRGELLKLEEELRKVENSLTEEIKKLEEEDSHIKRLQGEIDAKEAKQNQYKTGKEASNQLAEKLSADREQLLVEAKQLESDLALSLEKIAALMKQVETNSEDQKFLVQLNDSLKDGSSLLNELSLSYDAGTDRYVTLQKQYDEMEKEYKNLIEKQLSGGAA